MGGAAQKRPVSDRLDPAYVAFWAQRGALEAHENTALGVLACLLAALGGVAGIALAAPLSTQGLLGALALVFAALIAIARLHTALRYRVFASLIVTGSLLVVAALSDPFGLERTGDAYRSAAAPLGPPPRTAIETRASTAPMAAPPALERDGYRLELDTLPGDGAARAVLWSIVHAGTRKRCGRLTIIGGADAAIHDRLARIFERARRHSIASGRLSCG